MAKNSLDVLVEEQKILNKIFVIRGEKIMLDKDLAALFNVETRVLNQSLKRNIKRFPKDFMFQLNEKEFTNTKCDIKLGRQ
jgi:ORF6N domain